MLSIFIASWIRFCTLAVKPLYLAPGSCLIVGSFRGAGWIRLVWTKNQPRQTIYFPVEEGSLML